MEFFQATSALWYLLPLILVLLLVRSAWFKGVMGELIVNASARMMLDRQTYHLIRNVTLPTDDGGSTQIDHVIVSIYGLFVVETKNMKGWIFGNPTQGKWTQKIYGRSYQFQNPLHQNYKHVQTLRDMLGLGEEQVHSLVVFVGESSFKTRMPENVVQGFGYIRCIRSRREVVLSPTDVTQIVEAIEQGRMQPSGQTHKAHTRHVARLVADKQRIPTCPRCGSQMTLRVAKRGKQAGNPFWGCTRYPQCRATLADSAPSTPPAS